jgi:molecular chaperone DnaJ
MSKNFYIVLGVSSDADLGQIRSAYRKLVKLYHPDLSAEDVEKFHEIQQAWETLSDDDARKLHEKDLTRKKLHPPKEPLQVARRRRAAAVARRRGPSLEEEMKGLFSAVDEFFHGWVPGFFRRGRQVSRKKNLYVELILEPQEAKEGGLFPLKVPVEQPCGECNGTGYINQLTCPACHAQGRVIEYHEIEVSIPPKVTDGTQARLSLDDIGLNGVDLIVLVSVP